MCADRIDDLLVEFIPNELSRADASSLIYDSLIQPDIFHMPLHGSKILLREQIAQNVEQNWRKLKYFLLIFSIVYVDAPSSSQYATTINIVYVFLDFFFFWLDFFCNVLVCAALSTSTHTLCVFANEAIN